MAREHISVSSGWFYCNNDEIYLRDHKIDKSNQLMLSVHPKKSCTIFLVGNETPIVYSFDIVLRYFFFFGYNNWIGSIFPSMCSFPKRSW